jgi:hypothetical protein
VLLSICFAPLVAFGNTTSGACPESAVRIYVNEVGIVTVNGAVVPTELLKQALISLKPKPVEICYAPARAGCPMVPPRDAAAAATALNASEALGVPVSIYSDAKFERRLSLK